jgi:sugar lactone lactonase YvrE
MWHERRCSLFWLDISSKTVYEKGFSSDQPDYDRYWNIADIPSLIIEHRDDQDRLLLLTDKGIATLNMSSGEYQIVKRLTLPVQIRTNDGVVCRDGRLLFGTMEKSPTGINGDLYILDQSGNFQCQQLPIGIPNTFAQAADGKVVISDSLIRQMHLFHMDREGITQQDSFCNFPSMEDIGTPDGGMFDAEGLLWAAVWGSDRVTILKQGVEVASIKGWQVGQLSSCCFGGPEMNCLFITSALEGMNAKQQNQYPNAGKVMMVTQPDIKGVNKNVLNMDTE